MSKKILIVGVLDVVGSTNIAMKKGFEALGCEVDEYNYRTVMKKAGMQGMWADFEHKFLVGRRYDLIMFCKTNQMHPQLLDKAKEVGPTWYWFMDNLGVAKATQASTFAQNATFASATASDVAERFELVNKNSYHIIEGYDPSVYYYEDLRKIHDVLFVGNATITRIIEINNLRSAGVNVSIFGHGWPFGMKPNAPVFGEDERTEINQSKVVLNLCHDDVIFSDRIVKAMACGAVVISQPCKDLLGNTLSVHVPLYQSPESFIRIKEACKLSVSPDHINGYMEKHHSWKTVCQGILEKVGEYCGR